MGPIDLSQAKKLKEVEFWFDTNHDGRVAGTLNTIIPEHEGFEQVQIYPPFSPWDTAPTHFGRTADKICSHAMDLDNALVRLQELPPPTRVRYRLNKMVQGGSDAGPPRCRLKVFLF